MAEKKDGRAGRKDQILIRSGSDLNQNGKLEKTESESEREAPAESKSERQDFDVI
ncbi:hypothetical protein [Phreatobacter sp.]|uniref:hypothetical protein n=1 Tax=Phreatobacter sp. TaxID=1966341 RepID=UPI003F71A9C6